MAIAPLILQPICNPIATFKAISGLFAPTYTIYTSYFKAALIQATTGVKAYLMGRAGKGHNQT
jgi:hypothetical protein